MRQSLQNLYEDFFFCLDRKSVTLAVSAPYLLQKLCATQLILTIVYKGNCFNDFYAQDQRNDLSSDEEFELVSKCQKLKAK